VLQKNPPITVSDHRITNSRKYCKYPIS